jgi:hypothetical protein
MVLSSATNLPTIQLHHMERNIMNTKISGRPRLRRGLAVIAVAATLAAGPVLTATPANAASASCGSGSCTVYLNKAETATLASGRVPNIPLGPFTVPFRVAAYGHVGIARLWQSRGYCVAFTLNIRPWASQGMLGARC